MNEIQISATLTEDKQKKIVVLGMGGTIAGRSTNPHDNLAYKAGETPIGDLLLQSIGCTDLMGSVQIHAEQIAQIDSTNTTERLWQSLLQRCLYYRSHPDVLGIVITHGTDTIEETAYFLQCMLIADTDLGLSGSTVVLTCSMRPSTGLDPDGPQIYETASM